MRSFRDQSQTEHNVGKDLNKMKSLYEMFVDVVVYKKVTV